MIDDITKELIRKAKRRKYNEKRKQDRLYEKGKKQGGKYTHDINAKGNTVTSSTIHKLQKKLDDKKQREKTEILEKLRREKIVKRIKAMRKKIYN